MAAVLACGNDSGLSHRSCADKRNLRIDPSAIDVISPRRPGRKRTGIDAHTSSTLLPRDIEKVEGIPCTTVARTLLDLGAVLPRRVVERAFNQAEVLRVLDMRADRRRPGARRRTSRRRRAARDHRRLRRADASTRNDLEEAVLAICRAAGLPNPKSTSGSRANRSATKPTFCGARSG